MGTEDLATLIKQLREEEMGLSREGLARKLGTSAKTIERWENGKHADPILLLAVWHLASDPWRLRLLPHIATEIKTWAQEAFPLYFSLAERESRYSVEVRKQVFGDLELILNRAPTTVVENLFRTITSHARKYGQPHDKHGGGGE